MEKHCSEYLKAVRATKKFLYRGQHDTSLPIFVGYPRKNRAPTDSNPEAQELYDKYLSYMGFKALRSNSIFTTSDRYQAESFGNLFVIFPKNGFQFTWATEAADLVLSSVSDVTGEDEVSDAYYTFNDDVENLNAGLDEFINYTPENQNKDIKKTPVYKKFISAIAKWGNYDPDNGNVKKVYTLLLGVINTYMAFCAKFPKFKDISPFSYSLMKHYLKIARQGSEGLSNSNIESRATKMVKNFGLKRDNLAAALKSEHEVCILGEYIAVEFDKYEKQIKAYFLTNTAKKKSGVTKKNINK